MRQIAGLMLGLLWMPGIGSYATASVVTWTFQGVTFADGGTLSGSFGFDSTTGFGGTYSNFNIVTTAGLTSTGDSTGVPLDAFTFSSAGALDITYVNNSDAAQGFQICSPACSLGFSSGNHILTLYFSDDMGVFGPGLDGPSPVPIDHVNSWQGEGLDTRTPITGDVVSNTPEPISFALAGVGLVGLLGLRLRSRKSELS